MRVTEIYIELGITRSENFNSQSNRVGLRAVLESGDDVVVRSREIQKRAYDLLLKKGVAPAQAEPVEAEAVEPGAAQPQPAK